MGRQREVILLDTHTLVWLTAEPGKLSRPAASAIRRAIRGGGIAISAITLWELAWLASHSRLELTGTLEAYLEEIASRVVVLPLTPKIAALANQFAPDYSSDPCDRLIGATALAEGLLLVTKDSKIRDCRQIRTLW
jgi:PIN domain nuclease of toxin-antitoxin system